MPALRLRVIVAWLVALLVFTIPFESLVVIPALGTLTRAIGLTATVFGVVALFSRGRPMKPFPIVFMLLAFAFVFWNALSYYWSRAPMASLGGLLTYAQLLVFAFLVCEYCRTRHLLERLMQAYVLGAYIAFAFVTYAVLVEPAAHMRAMGPFNPNAFAASIALGIPMAAFLATRRIATTLTRAANGLYPLIAALSIVFSASRGGLVAAIVGLAALPFLLGRVRPVVRVLMFGVLGLAVWSAFVVFPALFPGLVRHTERLTTTSDEIVSGTLSHRTVIWARSLDVISQSPVIGVGSRAPRYVLGELYFDRDRSLHNTYLSVLAETGLVGLVLFGGLIGLAMISVISTSKWNGIRPFALVLLATLVVAMVPSSGETTKSLWFVLAILSSLTPIEVKPAGVRSGPHGPLMPAEHGVHPSV